MTKSTFAWLVCMLLALFAAKPNQFAPAENVNHPWVYPGDFREQLRQADLVVSGTIRSTTPSKTRLIQGVDLRSNYAEIDSDRVFKGAANNGILRFAWFSPAPTASGFAYAGPPLANFAVGKRYLVFLRKDDAGYVVTIPLHQIEVPLAPTSPENLANVSALPDQIRDSEIARELETAALSIDPPAPGVTGLAVTYFPYVVDLIGGCAQPLLQHLAAFPSKELRKDAQRWLSLLVDKHMHCEQR